MRFPIGNLVATAGVMRDLGNALFTQTEMIDIVKRHANADWGDVCDEDKLTNDQALTDGSRIISAYKLGAEVVWIITEADRSYTTILYPEEY